MQMLYAGALSNCDYASWWCAAPAMCLKHTFCNAFLLHSACLMVVRWSLLEAWLQATPQVIVLGGLSLSRGAGRPGVWSLPYLTQDGVVDWRCVSCSACIAYMFCCTVCCYGYVQALVLLLSLSFSLDH